jgi:hypothetical protein
MRNQGVQTEHNRLTTVAMKKDSAVVWGAAAIGKVIGRTERQTHWLLSQGAIKAARKSTNRKKSHWYASVDGLRRQFLCGGNEETDAPSTAA